ncbi:MAG TPA: thioredoxin, partial [Nocardioides sp.]|nr:thioredoxin [Nocardioides sp.]
MTTGAWIVVAAAALALAVGLWRAATDGRFRGSDGVRRETPDADPEGTAGTPAAEVVTATGHELGERATLLQFSSAFCAPCRATRRVLDEVTTLVQG